MAEQPPGSPPPLTFGHPDDPREWVRPANIISARIHHGTYPAGDWLPSIPRISDEFGLTRNRAIEALEELRAKGLISKAEKIGYYTGNGSPPRHQRRNHPPAARTPPTGLEGIAPAFFTITEIAAALRVSKMTVRRAIENGDIKNVTRIGRSYRIPHDSAAAYLKSCGYQPPADDPKPGTEQAGP